MPRRTKSHSDDYSDQVFPEDGLNEEEEEIDADVKDIFEEAQELDYGRGDLVRKLDNYTSRSPNLTGGDLDASWEYADIGEETVGGQNPTPDQSVVGEEGEALGLTYNDNEPLRTTDKLAERDREPWELDPASSPDFSERVKEEFNTPIEQLAANAGKGATATRARGGKKSAQTGPRKETARGSSAQAKRASGETGRSRNMGKRPQQPAARGQGTVRTDVSRSTRNNRATNVARGVRQAPRRVRAKTVKGRRTGKQH